METKSQTNHAFGSLGSTLVSQQESATSFKQVGGVFDVWLEVVKKDLEDMKDAVRPCDLKLGQLAIETDILRRELL